MFSFKPVGALLALAGVLLPAVSGAADDAAALRAELDRLKTEYATRLASLEARIDQLESAASVVADTRAAPPPVRAAGSAASAFNPALAMILAGSYGQLSQDPETYQIAGFIPSGGEIGPGERSFNLGESELNLSANVDPYFYANVTAAITPEAEIEVEEAYFRTLALPAGFTLKGGRFFSSLGYLNDVHAHAWDFVDQPLVYQAFFGGQLGQDGAQLKWLAPTDLFLEFGVESGNGEGFPGTRRNRNGLNGVALLAHVGGDLRESTSWRAGVSWLDQHAVERTYEDTDDLGAAVTNAFTGKSRTWVADAVLKWSPYGDPSRRHLKLQGEYMRRTENGELTFDSEGAALADTYRSEQSGWYVQSVYQFLPRWRLGVRYDALDSGSPRIGLVDAGQLPPGAFPLLLPASPDRFSVMLDWNLSEFSRLRTQYAWDDARNAERDRQFLLQYLFGIGAHGAHKY